jgi:hypothetical protein
MAGTNKKTLQDYAIEARGILESKNTYTEIEGSEYSAQHTRALSDTTTPIQGKGTGIFLDVFNGGGDYDINGNPTIVGSGRIKNLAINEYGNLKPYTAPDTSANKGQVIID